MRSLTSAERFGLCSSPSLILSTARPEVSLSSHLWTRTSQKVRGKVRKAFANKTKQSRKEGLAVGSFMLHCTNIYW